MSTLRTAIAIGDIHAEDEALAVVLEHARKTNPDAVLSVGDIVDGPGNASRSIELLESAGVIAVRGNHDRWILRDDMRELRDATPLAHLSDAARNWLGALPAVQSMDTSMGRLMLCHGLGDNDMHGITADDEGYALESNDQLQRILRDGEYAVVIAGHTHRRMVRRFGQVTIVNAGTLFRPHDPCFAWIDFENRFVHFFDVLDRSVIVERDRVAL